MTEKRSTIGGLSPEDGVKEENSSFSHFRRIIISGSIFLVFLLILTGIWNPGTDKRVVSGRIVIEKKDSSKYCQEFKPPFKEAPNVSLTLEISPSPDKVISEKALPRVFLLGNPTQNSFCIGTTLNESFPTDTHKITVHWVATSIN